MFHQRRDDTARPLALSGQEVGVCEKGADSGVPGTVRTPDNLDEVQWDAQWGTAFRRQT